MRSIKTMLFGVSIMVFGGPFLLGGGTGTIIGLVCLCFGMFISACGFIMEDDKKE